ncbi:hypothetical protein [Pelagibacterium mangrovi]|uniref:hypothetical protein n=1 Tax=Pelagibacterium mangrovi TaxID=3119828 RepID=UPI002FC64F13
MDNTKHNQPAAAQDSDDLIAELARLVAQDARNTSTHSDAYRREEPQVAPETTPDEPVQNDFYQAEQSFGEPADRNEPQPEPEWPAQDEPQPADDQTANFDFGFGTVEAPTSEASDADPIAELIADAEVEAYDRDFEQDGEWAEEVGYEISQQEPVEAAPSYQGADEFSVSAVEQPAAYARDDDPLSEIEALIGEAARANAGDTGFSGRRVRSSYLDNEPTDEAVNAAESAILAAAAATGASLRRNEPAMEPDARAVPEENGWETSRSEPVAAESEFSNSTGERIPDPLFSAPSAVAGARQDAADFDEEEAEYAEERPRRKINGFVLPIAAGVAIVALIGGVYFAFFSGPPEPGEAPVLTADSQPLKEQAEQTPTETAASESVVFNEIEGNTAVPEDEALVSRDQTGGASGADVAQVLAPEEGETELANRPVRTVTVRPDGTIVQADDSVAGSNVLPVERPDVPAVPNSTLTADPIGEAIAQAMSGETTAAADGGDAQLAALDAPAGVTETAADTTDDAATPLAGDDVTAPTADDTTAPRPIPRPAGLTAAAAPSTVPATPAAPAAAENTVALAPPQAQAATPAAQAPAASNVGAWVQLSSQRTEEEARGGIPTLQAQYGSLFNGATPEVSRVDLGERGIYYRVRLPQPTLAAANSVCGAILGQGGDCFVMDN